MNMRTPLARVRNHGSAKQGGEHWWHQRLTSIALVPLSLWLVFSLVSLQGGDHAAFRAWIGQFGNALLAITFILVAFHHAQAGLQVVIEDYVHTEAAKVGLIIFVKFATFLLGAAGILSVVRVGFGG